MLRAQAYRFETVPADLQEVAAPDQSPVDFARCIALAKAQAVQDQTRTRMPVLGADTDVSIDGRILGKPADLNQARQMLGALANREHLVVSAVAVIHGAVKRICHTETKVRLAPISLSEIDAYWASGEPADKAGAYAIQGRAARWVISIDGSYSGVVGLPLFETCRLLSEFNVFSREST